MFQYFLRCRIYGEIRARAILPEFSRSIPKYNISRLRAHTSVYLRRIRLEPGAGSFCLLRSQLPFAQEKSISSTFSCDLRSSRYLININTSLLAQIRRSHQSQTLKVYSNFKQYLLDAVSGISNSVISYKSDDSLLFFFSFFFLYFILHYY